jgi:hypothetical protein
MKFHYVGYRWTGGPAWPPFNGVLETSDEEAAKLVAAGNAVYLEDEPEPIAPGFAPLTRWTEHYDPELDAANQRSENTELTEYEADTPEEEDSGPKRPATYANKDAWIDYAVLMGEDREVAQRMTKVDLVSRWGASLLSFS